MSGGHWEYRDRNIEWLTDDVAHDRDVIERFPRLAAVIKAMGATLAEVIHDLDWDLSGDDSISDAPAFRGGRYRAPPPGARQSAGRRASPGI